MNSDEVQSVLHLSSACADEARTPQLRAAGQTTGVGPGIADVLGVRQRVQEARTPCWSSASALLRPLADLRQAGPGPRWYLEKLKVSKCPTYQSRANIKPWRLILGLICHISTQPLIYVTN